MLVKGVKKKGLLDAALEGDMTPLTRHMMMYLIATGAGSQMTSYMFPQLFSLGKAVWEHISPDFVDYIYEETNIPDRMGHPAQSLVEDVAVNFKTEEFTKANVRRRGLTGIMAEHAAGPLQDSMEAFITESAIDGIEKFLVPGTLGRGYKQGKPETVEDVTSVLGLKKYKFIPKQKKRLKLSY